MKYCLSNKVNINYRNKADEIVIPYKDRRAIPDYAKKHPKAALTLEVPPQTQWKIDEIKEYSILSKGRLTLCLPEIGGPQTVELAAAGIPYFWGYTITTFYELDAVCECGVSEVRIGAPIFFMIDKLKRFENVKKRVAANIAHPGYIPHTKGIVGAWIRPEDVDLYEGVIDTIEFADCDSNKEEALYRIYCEQKQWPGKVNMIISNIDDNIAYNRMLPRDFTEMRLNCGQKCLSGSACQACYRHFHLADPELIRGYAEAMNLL